MNNILKWTSPYGHTSVGQLAKHIHKLCADTVCHLEDIPRAIANKDG